MTRTEIEKHMAELYGCTPDYPWLKLPNYAVYRHDENKKWFAVVMDLPKSKFGMSDNTIVDVMNVKCDPLLIGSLLLEKGFYPAYHMNKENWVSVMLDGSVDREHVKWLIDISYDLTKKIILLQR